MDLALTGGHERMIDDPDQVERLLAKLDAHVPLAATTTKALAAVLRRQSPGITLPRRCQVTWAGYAGDEGGIVCRLDFGLPDAKEEYLASITHITFDRKAPLAREITAYQKRRSKRLRRQEGP